jgi:hypothetical protein
MPHLISRHHSVIKAEQLNPLAVAVLCPFRLGS